MLEPASLGLEGEEKKKERRNKQTKKKKSVLLGKELGTSEKGILFT